MNKSKLTFLLIDRLLIWAICTILHEYYVVFCRCYKAQRLQSIMVNATMTSLLRNILTIEDFERLLQRLDLFLASADAVLVRDT